MVWGDREIGEKTLKVKASKRLLQPRQFAEWKVHLISNLKARTPGDNLYYLYLLNLLSFLHVFTTANSTPAVWSWQLNFPAFFQQHLLNSTPSPKSQAGIENIWGARNWDRKMHYIQNQHMLLFWFSYYSGGRFFWLPTICLLIFLQELLTFILKLEHL